MSRDFDNGNPDYLRLEEAIVTVPPFTVSVWVRLPSITGTKCVWYIGNSSLGTDWFALLMAGTGDVRFQINDSVGGNANAVSPTSYTANTWHHIAAVTVTSSSSRPSISGCIGVSAANTTSVA